MNQSKRNFEARQQQIDTRLDRTWQPLREQPVLEGGNVRYEVSGRIEATKCGGLGMIQQVVEASGVGQAIDRDLHLLKRHLPYHESDHVLVQAHNLLLGGGCLENLTSLRRNTVFLDAIGARRIPDSTTAGDFLRRFEEEDVITLMNAINRARSNVWRAQPKSDRELAVIDVDGTQVETLGECKERMDIDYKGRWGFMPLVVSLANSQEPLFLVNRPGNRPSHDGAAHWMNQAVHWAREGAGFDRVRLRGDTDFALTTNFDGWSDDNVEFVFGMDANPSFVRRARELEPEDGEELADGPWERMERPRPKPKTRRKRPEKVKRTVVRERGFQDLTLEQEHVAELPYTPSKAKKTYRLIVLRKQIQVTKGQLRLDDEIRYYFYVTNIPAEEMSAAEVVRESNARCHQENLIKELKNGVQAMRLPVREFYGNWAYMVIGALAWNLKAWAGLLLPKSLNARELLRMEFSQFLHHVMQSAVQILKRSRQLIFRLLEVNDWTELLMEGTHRLKRGCLA